MNRIAFAPSGGHYLKINDFIFQNEANKKMFAALALAMCPDGVDKVIMNGVKFTTDSQSVVMTAGAVYYQGEIYEVTAGDVTKPFAECFLKIVEAPTGSRPMYIERKMIIDGDSGEISLPSLSYRANTAPSGTVAMWDPRPGQTLAQVYDADTGLGKDLWLGWVACDGRNDTEKMNGRVPIGYSATGYTEVDVVAGNEYNTIGAAGGKEGIKITANQSGLREHEQGVTAVYVQQSASSDGYGLGEAGGTTGRAFPVTSTGGVRKVDGNIALSGAQDALEDHPNLQPYRTVFFWQKL